MSKETRGQQLFPVQWSSTYCNNANSYIGVHLQYAHTKLDTIGLPDQEGHNVGRKGQIVFMRDADDTAGNTGLQVYYDSNANIWTRYGRDIDKQNPTQWEPWKRVGPFKISDLEADFKKFVTKPEYGAKLDNANKKMDSGMYQTDNNTQNLPDVGASMKWGVLLHFVENSSTGAGYQLFAPIDGDKKGTLYMRIITNGSTITDWYGLNIPLLSTAQNFFYKPEYMGHITNVDSPPTSGIYRTNKDQTVSGNLPNGISGESKYGILECYYEGYGHSQGMQRWTCIHSTNAGRTFRRHKDGGSWSNWIEQTSTGGTPQPIQGNYWELPTETIDSVTGQLDTGYYKTTETTTGMEGVPSGRKDGILKVIKDDNLSIQEYSPSKEGDNGYFLRTISVTAPISRQSSPFEEMNNESTHLLIHDTRNSATLNPSQYKSKAKSQKGFAVYEWKFTNQLTPAPSGESSERCILLTLEPDPSVIQTGKEYSDITQIAYVIDGSTWIRHGSNSGDSWQQWKKFGGTGGSSTQIDFQAELLKAFQAWEKQGTKDRTDEAEFIKWATNTRHLLYEEWISKDDNKSPEQTSFEKIVKKISTTVTQNLDFKKWIEELEQS